MSTYSGKMLLKSVMDKYRSAVSEGDTDKMTAEYLYFLFKQEFMAIPGVEAELKQKNMVFHMTTDTSENTVFVFTPIYTKPPFSVFPLFVPEYTMVVGRMVKGKTIPYQFNLSREFLKKDAIELVDEAFEYCCSNIKKFIELSQHIDDFMSAHNLTPNDINVLKKLEEDIRSICRSRTTILCADSSSPSFEQSIYSEAYREKLVQDARWVGVFENSPPSRSSIANQPISALGLTYRTENCLQRNGIHTVGDLLQTTVSHLRSIKGLGAYCLHDIIQALEAYSLELQP